MWSLALYLSQARTLKPTFPSLPQTWRLHKTAKKNTNKTTTTDI